MGIPNPDLEIQGEFQEEMPYAWGLQSIGIRQGGLLAVGINLGLKPHCAPIIQANAIIAPDVSKQGKTLTVVFPFLNSKYHHGKPLKMKL